MQNFKCWAVTDVWSFLSQSERNSSDGNLILRIAASAEKSNDWKELSKTWHLFFAFEVLQTPGLQQIHSYSKRLIGMSHDGSIHVAEREQL